MARRSQASSSDYPPQACWSNGPATVQQALVAGIQKVAEVVHGIFDDLPGVLGDDHDLSLDIATVELLQSQGGIAQWKDRVNLRAKPRGVKQRQKLPELLPGAHG